MQKINKKQFLEMAERERDAWIAEFIMGNEIIWRKLYYHEKKKPYTRNHSGKLVHLLWYSTDANAMMRVIEKMREDGYKFPVIWATPKGWNARFGFHDVAHENLQTAVCLAAGRAIGAIE